MKLLSHRTILIAVCCTAPTLIAGCAAWREAGPVELVRKLDLPEGVPWKQEGPRRGTPRRMVITWTDAVKQQAGTDPERGFGGRVFFYDSSESDPIAVEGQLVVYAFDESDRLPTDNQPDKRYVFPPDQFAMHEGDSELGTSYSVWLPWDKVSGLQTEVSLIARFESVRGGAVVMSEQNRIRLPGQLTGPSQIQVAGHTQSAPSQTPGAVEQAGYTTSIEYREPESRGMESTTIKLPTRK